MTNSCQKSKKKMGNKGHRARCGEKAYWKRSVFRSFGHKRRNQLHSYQQIKYVTWRTPGNANLLICPQLGLFSQFLPLISLFQEKSASHKDNCKSSPAFAEIFHRIWIEIAKKIKTSHIQNSLFFDKIERISKGSDLSKNNWGSPCI